MIDIFKPWRLNLRHVREQPTLSSYGSAVGASTYTPTTGLTGAIPARRETSLHGTITRLEAPNALENR